MKKLRDFKIMPVFPGQPVADPQLSPDGNKVLFTYSRVNMEEDKYETHLWMLKLAEKEPFQFTSGKNNDSAPRWSPDGKWVAFLSNRVSEDEKPTDEKKRKNQLWIMAADGGEARRLTSCDEGVQKPMWSPDGKAILFTSSVQKGEKVKDSDVKIIRRIRYKLNGRGFFEGKFSHLFVVPAKGGKVKELTDGEFDVDSAVFSTDGKQLTFVSNLDEDSDLSFLRNIYSITANGGTPKLLWKGQGPIGVLGWSPDSKYLAFTGRVIEDPSLVYYKNTGLWILDIRGKTVRNLTELFDQTVTAEDAIDWSPDSKEVYFRADDQGGVHLFRVSLSGKVAQLTKGTFTVNSVSIDSSGKKLVCSLTDAKTPSEVYLLNGSTPTKLTNLNKQLLKEIRVVPPEEFWFTASDGVKVQGWIVRPRDFSEEQKYPTIVEIHGGPHSAYGFKLMPAEHEFQVLADHGFAVVYTNPRASVGYGEAFARITGHWGERDYEDIMEAVDYVTKTYRFVDSERLGVAGGSYGGFMTNWIVGHTDRFKAAVSMRGISNWYSFHGSSDIGWMSLPTHEMGWGKDPWDNLDVIMEKSPITYVKNVKTPLLILQSEEDYRCPMEQAEQMFAALKKLKKTVELVRFPGENHELSRSGKPKHRVERLQHIVRWFDQYLKQA